MWCWIYGVHKKIAVPAIIAFCGGIVSYLSIWRKNKMGYPFPYKDFEVENANKIEFIMKYFNQKLNNDNRLSPNSFYSWPLLSYALWYMCYFDQNSFKEI